MKNNVKVDHIGFNVSHWSKKTEDEFVKDGIAAGNHPVGLSDPDKTAWLKKAHGAIKEAASPKKEVATDKKHNG